MDALVSGAAFQAAKGGDPGRLLEEAGTLTPYLSSGSEDPVEFGSIRLRYMALVLRSAHRPQAARLQEQGESLLQSLIRLKPVDPGFWMALAQFHEACGNPAAAARERVRGRALNPRMLGD
jgi:hypothetical protein